MKPLSRFAGALCILLLSGAGCSRATTTHPSGANYGPDPTDGHLIKGTSITTVYYLGRDGKRYVFPNDKTYLTWFPTFSYVRKLTDNDLIQTSLGGNVTYKPGSRLLKIDTDPSVYVVTHGGVIRKIASEELASQLFGSDWKSLVDDMPDPFFVNYKIGDPITDASQFSVATAAQNSATIDDDKNLQMIATPTTP